MEMMIEGSLRKLTPLRDFREQYALPQTFGVAHFEPKDYTGLAHIDTAGSELNGVRQVVLSAVPKRITAPDAINAITHLRDMFHQQLLAINARVELKAVEIDYAVSGFEDVCLAVVYAHLRAASTHAPVPPFMQVYGQWFHDGVRVSSRIHPYTHDGETWQIRIINSPYGRAGLIVDTGDDKHYVLDTALGCPAEGYMLTLLRDVADKLYTALN